MDTQLAWVDGLGFMPVIEIMPDTLPGDGWALLDGYNLPCHHDGGWDFPQRPVWWHESFIHWVVT